MTTTEQSTVPLILIIGKNGQVGWELRHELLALGKIIALGREELDLCVETEVREVIRRFKPSIIVNAAAYTAVDSAEDNQELARKINAVAVGIIAQEAESLGALLIHYSTDYVFGGNELGRYTETSSVGPLNVYGQTKLEGELEVANSGVDHFIFRTGWVYGSRGKNFLLTMLRLMAERESLSVVDDQLGAPTPASLIAQVTAIAVSQYFKEKNQDMYGQWFVPFGNGRLGKLVWVCGKNKALLPRVPP